MTAVAATGAPTGSAPLVSTEHVDAAVTLHAGDCLLVLAADELGYDHRLGYAPPLIATASVDAVVTHPPYGLEFMGKDWDRFRLDDPGTNRHRGDHAGQHGEADRAEGRGAFGRVAYGGGKRPTTSRCTVCGKRDQFRNPHPCKPDAEWITELIREDGPPPSMVAFGEWCRRWATECRRVLKPGGHLLAFGGTRTWHRLTCAIEDAGFEIRDSLAWMYSSGFPKSMDIEKAMVRAGEPPEVAAEHRGKGTALKPAFEPIVVARKPLTTTVATNVQTHGTGVLHIDACRAAMSPLDAARINAKHAGMDVDTYARRAGTSLNLSVNPMPLMAAQAHDLGRHPANVLLDDRQADQLDKQSRDPDGLGASRYFIVIDHDDVEEADATADLPVRFIYTSKPTQTERVRIDGTAHPTVKPLALMRWLVRLVTPPGGTVLEPFAGSGTTVEACLLEGLSCVAIEQDRTFLPLIRQRVARRRDPVAAVLGAGQDGGLFDLLTPEVTP